MRRRLAGPVLAVAILSLRALPAAADVRIGVFGLFHPRELRVASGQAGGLTLRTERETCALRGHEAAVLSRADDVVRAVCGGRVIEGRVLRVMGLDGGAAVVDLQVPGRMARTFHGRLDVHALGGELVPIVLMDLEVAVASVVAAELADGTPHEALKAQAVAARSYFAAARGRHRGFAFCDTTHCQFLREPPRPGSPAARAAHETAGLVIAYRGTVVEALYSASCGGRTRSRLDAGLASAPGYAFVSVECAHCRREALAWQRRVPLDSDARRLDADRSEAARIRLARRRGWSAVPGGHFDANQEEDALVLYGRGSGHGIGLCQLGARGLASAGLSYEGILAHYYPGTIIEVISSGRVP